MRKMGCKRSLAQGNTGRFLVTYLCILLIPMLMMQIFVRDANQLVTEQSVAHAESVLRQVSVILDNCVENSYSETVSFYNSENMQTYLNRTMTLGEYRVLSHKIIKAMPNKDINNLYEHVLIFMTEYDYILTSGLRINRQDFLYSFRPEGISAEEWEKSVYAAGNGQMLPGCKVTYLGKNMDAVPLVYHSSVVGAKKQATIVYMLDRKYIAQMLSALDLGEEGCAYLLDRDGNILLSEGNALPDLPQERFSQLGSSLFEVDGVRMLAIVQESAKGYSLAYTAPEAYVLRNVQTMTNSFYRFIGIAAVIGLLCAALFTVFNLRPLKEALSEMFTLREKNELTEIRYQQIRDSMSALTAENEEMNDHLRSLMTAMRRAVLDAVINAPGMEEGEMERLLSEVDISLKDGTTVIAVARILDYGNRYDGMEFARLATGSAMEQRVGGQKCYFHYVGVDKILLMLSFTEESEAFPKAMALVQSLVQQAMENDDVELRAGVSDPCAESCDIARGYREALEALNTPDAQEACMAYRDLPESGEMYDYSPATASSLIELTAIGNAEAVMRTLQEVYESNLVQRRMSESRTYLLLNDLYATALKAAERVAYAAEDIKLEKLSVEEGFTRIAALMDSAARSVNEGRMGKGNQLVSAITAEIDAHYTEPEFDLTTLAHALNYSESHVSHLFRKETGESLSKAIENKRIALACEKLRSGDWRMKELARSVGYANDITFLRAFKRVTGLKPSEWRSENEQEE